MRTMCTPTVADAGLYLALISNPAAGREQVAGSRPVRESVTPGLYRSTVMSEQYRAPSRSERDESWYRYVGLWGRAGAKTMTASAFYSRFSPPELSDDDQLGPLEIALAGSPLHRG